MGDPRVRDAALACVQAEHERLSAARSVLIIGGGIVGVELAGEVGAFRVQGFNLKRLQPDTHSVCIAHVPRVIGHSQEVQGVPGVVQPKCLVALRCGSCLEYL